MSATPTRAQSLRTIVRDGVADPLNAGGFQQVGRKHRWMRPTAELVHIVVVGHRHGSYAVEFHLGCSPAAVILRGAEPSDPSDPNFSIAQGAALDFRHSPRLYGFDLDDGMTADEVATLAEDARDDTAAIAAWLDQFQKRADLRRHLVKTRGAGFRVPTGDMGLVDLTAAILAVLDRSPDAAELVEAAVSRWERWPDDKRINRLNVLVEAASV